MSVDEQELIKWRLEVIAKESADTAIGAAAAQNLAAWQAEAAQQQAAPSTAASSEQPAPQASVAEAPAVQPQPEPAMPAPPPIKPVEAKIEQIEPAENKPVEPQPAPAPSQPTVLSPNAYRRRTRVLTPEERNALTKTHLTSRPKPKDDTPETMTKPSLCSCIRSSWIGSESLRFDPMRDYDRWDTQGRPCIASGVACPRNHPCRRLVHRYCAVVVLHPGGSFAATMPHQARPVVRRPSDAIFPKTLCDYVVISMT